MLNKPRGIDTFNIRVYGIWINKANEVLLMEEKIKSNLYLKFPGGGLEFGEGTLDCLKREFKEETGLEVQELEHFYTTDFFQPSMFHPRHQVISIYYKVKCSENQPIQLPKNDPLIQRFFWLPIDSNLKLSLPIDQHVARLLIQKFAD